jgi:hypothetical protein
LVLLAAATVSAGLILYLGRHLTFFHDEWSFLSTRTGWSLDDFMRPHNEHWALGVAIPWKLLLATVGLRSYLPYLALAVATHLLCAGAVYYLVRTQAGRAIGLIFAVVFLFLGAAGEDLFWAFQAGFIGGSAAGAWGLAILLARPSGIRRVNVAVAVLLLIAVATHGPGLFFLSAVGITILAIPARRRQWPVLVPAIAVYAIWYLIWGRSGVESDFGASLLNPELLFEYVKVGLSTAFGSILGIGTDLGLIVTVVIVAGAAWRYISTDRFAEGAVAGAAGLLIQFVAQGVARATDGPLAATAPRYAYMVAIFGALAIAALLPRHSTSSPLLGRTRLVAVIAIAALLPLAANVTKLGLWAESFRQNTLATRAQLELVADYGGSPAVPSDVRSRRSDFKTIPGPARLNELFAQYGSPLDDPRLNAEPIPDEVRQAALFDLVRPDLRSAQVVDLPSVTRPLPELMTHDLEVAPSGSCASLTPTGGDPQVVVHAAGGWTLYLEGRRTDQLEVYLSSSGDFHSAAMAFIPIGDTGVLAMPVPDLGSGRAAFLRLDPSADGPTTICAGDPLPIVTGSGSTDDAID